MKGKQRQVGRKALAVVAIGVVASDCAFFDLSMGGAGGAGGAGGSTTSSTSSSTTSSTSSSAGAVRPSCWDQVKNGLETDVNCGGGCPPCADDKTCIDNADCANDNCADGVCAPCIHGVSPGCTSFTGLPLPDGGVMLWGHLMGDGHNAEVGRAVALDGQGNVLIAGTLDVSTSAAFDFCGPQVPTDGAHKFFLAKYTTSGGAVWAKAFTAAQYPEPGMGLTAHPDGRIVLTGTSPSGVTIRGVSTGSGLFVATFEGSGDVAWAQAVYRGEGHDVAVDNVGNAYVTGRFSSSATFHCTADQPVAAGDIVVMKLDGAGSCVWGTVLAGAGGAGRGIAVDSAGGHVFVTGDFTGGLTGCPSPANSVGGADAFVARLSAADGTCEWLKTYGDGDDQTGRSIAVDSAGDVIVAGDFDGTVSIGPDGGVAVGPEAGVADPSMQPVQVFAMKLSGADGATVWGEAFPFGDVLQPDPNHPAGLRVVVDGAGHALLAGSKIVDPSCQFSDKSVQCRKIFATKLAPDGGGVWTRFLEGPGYDSSDPKIPYGLAVDDGGVYLGGTFGNYVFAGKTRCPCEGYHSYNIFLLKLDNP